MKLLYTNLSFLIFFSSLNADATARQAFTLNKIDAQAKQVNALTLTGVQQQRQYFSLNEESVLYSAIQKGDWLEVHVSSSESHVLKVTRVDNYTEQTVSYQAMDENNPETTFTFTYSDGKLFGLFHLDHKNVFFFEYDSDVQQNYMAKRSSFYDDEQVCNVHELGAEEQLFRDHIIRAKSVDGVPVSHHPPNLSAMAASLEDEVTIDILIPYTTNALLWAEDSSFNSIETVIANAMALAQAALDNSNVYINLRLVHYYETDYTEDTLEKLDEEDEGYVSSGDHLRRLTRDPDNHFDLCGGRSGCSETDYDGFMEEVHQYRETYGADLVSAVLSEPNTGGLAWTNNSMNGNSSWGFSINRVQQIGTGYTLIHEIGHNMGNAHARNQIESKAGDFGGIFVYSAGNRFSAESDDYATVMAYAQEGYQAIPYFSNPDVQYLGVNTGNNLTYTGDSGPSDNARSMRETKRTIASYYPTQIDPPVVDVEEISISVSLDAENSTATVPVTIRNNGDSDLMWDLDFDIQSSVLAKQKTQPVTDFIDTDPDFEPYAAGNVFAQSTGEGVIFSTNFESSEGFSAGDHTAVAGWRSFSTTAPFELSDENPSSGGRHLRLPRRSETSNSVFSRSPYFGPQPMGEFIVSFDMATQVTVANGTNALFDVYIYDASTGTISAGLIINAQGDMFAQSINESGQETFGGTNTTFPDNGSYNSMEIRFNPNNQTIDYYMNGAQFASNPYPIGRKPDYIYFGQRNEISGAYMDIDNIEIKRVHTPFNWLNAENMGGMVAPSSSQTAELSFNAVDVETGTYQTVLQVRSNDPVNPLIEVPVTAEIELATHAEYAPELPDRVTLNQNFPNPFNPTTRIKFNLNQTAHVKLEVFNITGQKVATLVQETLNAGQHEQTFDAGGLSSGVYIYRLQTPSESFTRQMILIK